MDNVVTDNGPSSTCSSEIEGLSSSSWLSSEFVDNPRLEVTKTTRVAEILKPVLMNIESPTILSSKIQNIVINDKKSRSRQNNILKREFFANYEKRINKNNLLTNSCANDDKLKNYSNFTLNFNGNINESGIENLDKNRNNAKKHLVKKLSPKIEDYKDSRDENSVFIDVTNRDYSLKNNREQLENDDTNLKDIENFSKNLGSKSKKRCVKKLNIPSKSTNTSVDNLKSSVIKTQFHPLIRCSDVISSTDSESISGTKSKVDTNVKSEEIITVDCNFDHCQEVNFIQQLNIDLEEQVESDLESGPLSPESLSEPLQAPSLVQKVLDSNFQIKHDSCDVIKTESKEDVTSDGNKQDGRIIFNEDHVEENTSVIILKDREEKSSENRKLKNESNDQDIIKNVVSEEVSDGVQEVIIHGNFDSNDVIIPAIESEINEEGNQSFINIQVIEDVPKSISSDNIDINENIPTIESEKTMINEFQNEKDELKSDHDDHDSSVSNESDSTSKKNLNETFSKVQIKESSWEENENVQDELQILSNSSTDSESSSNNNNKTFCKEEILVENKDENIISRQEDGTGSESDVSKNSVLDSREELEEPNSIDDKIKIEPDDDNNTSERKLKSDETNCKTILQGTDIKYEDFVKEIHSSSSEGENHSFSIQEEESFHLKGLFSIQDNSEESAFDEIFNVDYEAIEDIEEFPSQKVDSPAHVEDIEAFIDEIFSFKHSDVDVNKLFSKVYKKIVHNQDEAESGIQEINKSSPKNVHTNIETEKPPTTSERRDSITEMINNINVNYSSSITTFENLPETDNSLKYNLDPTNMSLIYSLTPSTELSSKKGVSSKNTSIEMMGLSLESFELFDNFDSSRCLKHDIFEWLDLASVKKVKDDILDTQRQLTLVKSFPNIKILTDYLSDETTSDVENNSTQGSDILELPTSTYLELKKNEDESFRQELNSTVNEIISDLEKTEIYTSATNFVDDIIYDITCLNMYIDVKNLKEEARLLMQNRIYAFLIVKDIIERLISTLPGSDQEELNSQMENDLQSNTLKNLVGGDENLDNFIVIREIVHHIIDKLDYENPVSIPKELKETVNIELKKCPNKIADETGVGFEELLEKMKDDEILPCDCPKCLPTENREVAETQKDKECIKQLLHLMSNNQDLIPDSVQDSVEGFPEENSGDDVKSEEIQPSEKLEEISPESDDEEDVLNLRDKLLTMFSSESDRNTKYPTSTVNSSPSEIQSAESENFAEQEVTSESTDNDTKSDNSREKETLRLDTGKAEVLNDREFSYLWNIRENKIEESCKNERFQFLEKTPSFIHFGDFEEKEKICTCCLEVNIGEDESSSKLPPIEELNESTEFLTNEHQKSFDHSLLSPRSLDFFTCRDGSDTTKEDIDCDENQNATYSISDASDSDKISELEYNADVSSNLEKRKSESFLQRTREDFCNNTTLNFADVSASTMISDIDTKDCLSKKEYHSREFETSQEVESIYKNPPDYMTYSYDTKEFMKLEKHLEEHDSAICCNFKKSDFSTDQRFEEKFEETSLYRVITQMNLSDTDSYSTFSLKNDSRDSLE